MMMTDGFRERLQRGLTAAGINQAELARRAGVTRAYVGRLLAGSQTAPTAEVVGALAEALRLTPGERVGLHAAAGLLPAELAPVLDRPAVARLLTTLATQPAERRERLEFALTALLDLLDPAV